MNYNHNLGDFVYDFKAWNVEKPEKPQEPENPDGAGFNYNLDYRKMDGRGQMEDRNDDYDGNSLDEKLEKLGKPEEPTIDYDFKSWKVDSESEGENVRGFNYKFDSYQPQASKSSNDFTRWESSENDADDDDANHQSKFFNRLLQNFFSPALTRMKRQDYLATGAFGYDFDQKRIESFRQGFERQTVSQGKSRAAKYHWAPGSVVSPGSWADFREMLINSMPTKKAAKNFALFMFCKLKNFF